ncbi:MAG TPA: hypothetical protein VN873_03365 [Candidatus Angelobacter sp.]|nr:hypothetical protein [Candidatus Angelobacter sp.]
MNLLSVENDQYVFHLSRREMALLTLVLRLYPVIPPAHQPLSKTGAKSMDANQRLLDEALAEQRKENKKSVETLLADHARFHESGNSIRMTLKATDIEWLLQVLNDVHVGSWILLGSPQKELPLPVADDPRAPQIWALELARHFQSSLIDALNHGT